MVDRFLNAITMYRLTLYYLIFLLVCAVAFGALGWIHYQPITIAINALAAVIACYSSNWLFARLWGATTNSESGLITGLILALLVPATSAGLGLIIATSILAMGSKYFLTVEKTHIFNPAAAAIAGIALLSPEHAATWWVGNIYLVIPVLLGGLLLMRKIQRSNVIWWFLGTYTLTIAVASLVTSNGFSFLHTLWVGYSTSAILFFAFVMLTEPLTLPGQRLAQNWYAGIVALLYATPQLHFLPLSLTPELALTSGNVLSHFISPKQRLVLNFIDKRQLAAKIWLYTFTKPAGFRFRAGQYLEWTLPHLPVDSRGNRRYFTIASSPSEQTIQLLVKVPAPASSFKQALQLLGRGDQMVAGSLMGDFVLPPNSRQKLAFIAGGVGVAPFRSFAKLLLDSSQKRDVVMLYSNRQTSDITFAELFDQARAVGWRTVYTLTDRASLPTNWPGEIGAVDVALMKRAIPDFRERTFYISGPQPMVQKVEQQLAELGIAKRRIITDYFPGYAE